MRAARNVVALAILAVTVVALRPFTASVSARLVSVQHLPEGSLCEWEQGPRGILPDLPMAPLQQARLQQARFFTELQQGLQQRTLFAPLQQRRSGVVPDPLIELARSPVRTLRDTYATYTAIALNFQTDEVILQDNNLWATRIFNRLDDTPAGAESLKPKREISGPETELQINNGLYVDPENGDMYSVESDVGDKMVVFSRDAQGNVQPKRRLETPHRVYNIAVNEEKQELYITREYPGEVVVYRKQASGTEQPLRILHGDNTGLEAPHGLAIDVKNQLLFVNNWGLADGLTLSGSGRFNPPSIKVYPLDAKNNTRPVRVIQGDRTQLNWPGAMSLDPDTGDLYVANDVEHSILVFRGASHINGNVPPTRVIKGARTGLRNPTGVFVDARHQELWVSNLGNASAAVYPLTASGDVAPLRTIRSAPRGHATLTLGRSTAVTYDSKRQELLVPN
jgi:6-phosphogluconolactonase (cycloisomerase 2 family)